MGEAERGHDLGLAEGARALRLERDLPQTRLLRRRQDRLDFPLVVPRQREGLPAPLRRGEPSGVPEEFHPSLAGACRELSDPGPLAIVELQVVERGGLGEDI